MIIITYFFIQPIIKSTFYIGSTLLRPCLQTSQSNPRSQKLALIMVALVRRTAMNALATVILMVNLF